MMRLLLHRVKRPRSPAAEPGGARVGQTPRARMGWVSKQRIRPVRRAQILRFFEDRPPGRVLDVTAGSLWLAGALAGRRFEVHALDLMDQESSARTAGIRYVRGNLDDGLPQFDARTFDYVVCTEALEHLEHPALLLREFARLLRPHGVLLVTTPNIVSLRSRLKFLLFGYFDGFRRRALFRCLGRPGALDPPHISPLHIQFLYYWLVGAGFTHIQAHPLAVRRIERLALLPLAALVVTLGRAAGHDAGDCYQSDFLTLLISRPLLFSPTLILSARRAERADDGADAGGRVYAAREKGPECSEPERAGIRDQHFELAQLPGPSWCRRIPAAAVVLGQYCGIEHILDGWQRHRCRLSEAHEGQHVCWCDRVYSRAAESLVHGAGAAVRDLSGMRIREVAP